MVDIRSIKQVNKADQSKWTKYDFVMEDRKEMDEMGKIEDNKIIELLMKEREERRKEQLKKEFI